MLRLYRTPCSAGAESAASSLSRDIASRTCSEPLITNSCHHQDISSLFVKLITLSDIWISLVVYSYRTGNFAYTTSYHDAMCTRFANRCVAERSTPAAAFMSSSSFLLVMRHLLILVALPHRLIRADPGLAHRHTASELASKSPQASSVVAGSSFSRPPRSHARWASQL